MDENSWRRVSLETETPGLQEFLFTVPKGSAPGSQIRVLVPAVDGTPKREIMARVPEDVRPGERFKLQLPFYRIIEWKSAITELIGELSHRNSTAYLHELHGLERMLRSLYNERTAEERKRYTLETQIRNTLTLVDQVRVWVKQNFRHAGSEEARCLPDYATFEVWDGASKYFPIEDDEVNKHFRAVFRTKESGRFYRGRTPYSVTTLHAQHALERDCCLIQKNEETGKERKVRVNVEDLASLIVEGGAMEEIQRLQKEVSKKIAAEEKAKFDEEVRKADEEVRKASDEAELVKKRAARLAKEAERQRDAEAELRKAAEKQASDAGQQVSVAMKAADEAKRKAQALDKRRMPSYWEQTTARNSPDRLAIIPLSNKSDQATLNTLQALLETDGAELAKGHDVMQPGRYDRLRCVRAWRLEHVNLWEAYAAGQRQVVTDMQVLQEKGLYFDQWPANEGLPTKISPSAAKLPGSLRSDEANEAILMHGTQPGPLLSILVAGPNERYSGSNAGTAFGDGI
jgi:hypothetical protein